METRAVLTIRAQPRGARPFTRLMMIAESLMKTPRASVGDHLAV